MLVVGVVTFSAPGLNGTTGAVAVDARANTKYFVTVDAGSSGSRVFVYVPFAAGACPASAPPPARPGVALFPVL